MGRPATTAMASAILDEVEDLHVSLNTNGQSANALFAIERLLRALLRSETTEADRSSSVRRLERLRDDHKGDGSLLLAAIDDLRPSS